VGAAPFLLERMPYWRRWSSPPAIVLNNLARPDCLDELVGKFATTVEISLAALRAALRFGLLDNHLLSVSRTARRPEFRATMLKIMLDSEVTWSPDMTGGGKTRAVELRGAYLSWGVAA